MSMSMSITQTLISIMIHIHIDIEFSNLIVEVVPFRIGMRFGFGQSITIRITIRMKNTDIQEVLFWPGSHLGGHPKLASI